MINPFNNIRTRHWWAYKATPVWGMIYFYCCFIDLSFIDIFLQIFFFMLTFIGFAGLGYVINDLSDIQVDRKAGKKNFYEEKTLTYKLVTLSILSLLAIAPWLYLKVNLTIILCLSALISLILLYSNSLTRFKENRFLGPVCDAVYGHVLPIFITCLTFEQYLETLPYRTELFFFAIVLWQFFKGLRNILIHQLDDCENDLKAGVKTLAIAHGKSFVHTLILYFILPMEFVSLVVFMISITSLFPSLWILLPSFVFIYIYAHGLLRFTKWDSRRYQDDTYIFFLNDFYEIYLPYYFLLLLCTFQPKFSFFLIVHTILFPNHLNKIRKDIVKARKASFLHFKDTVYPLYRLIKRY